MKKKHENRVPIESRRAINTKELAEMLSCGTDSAKKVGTQAGARIKIGRCVLWNLQKVDDYLNRVSE